MAQNKATALRSPPLLDDTVGTVHTVAQRSTHCFGRPVHTRIPQSQQTHQCISRNILHLLHLSQYELENMYLYVYLCLYAFQYLQSTILSIKTV